MSRPTCSLASNPSLYLAVEKWQRRRRQEASVKMRRQRGEARSTNSRVDLTSPHPRCQIAARAHLAALKDAVVHEVT